MGSVGVVCELSLWLIWKVGTAPFTHEMLARRSCVQLQKDTFLVSCKLSCDLICISLGLYFILCIRICIDIVLSFQSYIILLFLKIIVFFINIIWTVKISKLYINLRFHQKILFFIFHFLSLINNVFSVNIFSSFLHYISFPIS